MLFQDKCMRVWDITGNKPEFVMEQKLNLGVLQVLVLDVWCNCAIFFLEAVLLYESLCLYVCMCVCLSVKNIHLQISLKNIKSFTLKNKNVWY